MHTMSAIQDILAATDFTGSGSKAVHRAARLAMEQRARLELLHIVHSPALESLRPLFPSPTDVEKRILQDARTQLEKLATAVAAETGVRPGTGVHLGHVVDGILAGSEAADLLVVGARGANPVRDLLIGSTAERLLRKSQQPVLMVNREPAHAYRRVLVPMDFTPVSGPLLRMAMQLAPEARITAFHAFDIPFEAKLWLTGVPEDRIQDYRDKARQFSIDALHALIGDAGADAGRCEAVAELGEAAPLILDQAAAIGADLIVMGKRDQTVAEELLLGSVARRVLASSDCDVLVLT